jgi:hypothetical protein
VEPDSPEALHYTELILSLCCFAEYLEIDDLADRCVDALRCHEHACGGSLLGRHLQEVYTHTERKSKLRHFIAVSAADFLKNTQDTVEHQASRAAIFALCKSMPQFERDVGEARSVFGKKLEARDKIWIRMFSRHASFIPMSIAVTAIQVTLLVARSTSETYCPGRPRKT